MVDFVRAFRGGNQVVDEEPEAAPATVPALHEAAARSTESTADRVRGSRSSMSEKSDRLFRRFCVIVIGSDGKGLEQRPITRHPRLHQSDLAPQVERREACRERP